MTFHEMYPDEQVLATDDFGLLHNDGGFTNGRLILTQKRLVFVISGGLFGPKQRTDHAIELHLIDNISLEEAQSLGVNLRVDFSTFEGPATMRYHGRLNQAKKIVGIISERMNYGLG